MSESRQDQRKYEPINVEFNHYDTGKVETVGLYTAQAKFLYSFALSGMTKCPVGAFIMISTAFLCDKIQWSSRDICKALVGNSELAQAKRENHSDPTKVLDQIPDHQDEDSEAVAS